MTKSKGSYTCFLEFGTDGFDKADRLIGPSQRYVGPPLQQRIGTAQEPRGRLRKHSSSHFEWAAVSARVARVSPFEPSQGGRPVHPQARTPALRQTRIADETTESLRSEVESPNFRQLWAIQQAGTSGPSSTVERKIARQIGAIASLSVVLGLMFNASNPVRNSMVQNAEAKNSAPESTTAGSSTSASPVTSPAHANRSVPVAATPSHRSQSPRQAWQGWLAKRHPHFHDSATTALATPPPATPRPGL